MAHRQIERYRQESRLEHQGIRVVEHESGPEILAYLQVTAAGAALSAAVINLVAAIVKARSEGRKQGDRSGAPFELIIRRFDRKGDYAEEKILRLPSDHEIDAERLSETLINYQVSEPDKKPARAKAKRRARKKR